MSLSNGPVQARPSACFPDQNETLTEALKRSAQKMTLEQYEESLGGCSTHKVAEQMGQKGPKLGGDLVKQDQKTVDQLLRPSTDLSQLASLTLPPRRKGA